MSLGFESLGLVSLGLPYGASREEYSLNVWPFRPNWKSGLTEAIEWRTDVLRAHDGSEQRRAVRARPRRTFEFDLLLANGEAEWLEMLLWRMHGEEFALPVWTDRMPLSAVPQAGQQILYGATTGLQFVEGGYALIFQSTTTWEIVQVSAVASGSVALAQTIVGDFMPGVVLYPLVFAEIADTVQLTRVTDQALTGRALFRVVGGDTDPAIAPSETYQGVEVYLTKPDWSSGISHEFSRAFHMADAEVGPWVRRAKEKSSSVVRGFGWLLHDRAAITAFRAFAHRRRGQHAPVWMPSWHDDLRLAADAAAGAVELLLEGTEYTRYFGTTPDDRSHLMIRLADGSRVYRQVLSATFAEIGAASKVTLDTALVDAIAVEDVVAIHIIQQFRLATDKIEIPWVTNQVARPSTNFRSLIT